MLIRLYLQVVAAVGSLAVMAGLMTGCESIGDEVQDLASGIDPVSPPEAARMMIDPYNADNRRRGTVLISNAPFGGVDHYLCYYRDMVNNERDPIVKATAIRALARHGAPEDALRIVRHLRLCDECIRRNREAGLSGAPAELRRQDCQTPACLSDHVQVRWEAAKGLQRLHNPSTITELLKILRNESEHSDVRIAAAVALGQYPEDRVFQGLVAALDARELAINVAAEKSLTTLTGQSLGLDGLRWFAWYNSVGPSNDPFAGKTEYLYPTYVREESMLEKLAFWTNRNFEQPAPPSGLRPESERTTYDDQNEPSPVDAGG